MINKNFSLLLSGQLVSQVGDKFHMIALSFWVLETTGSSAKMGAVLAAALIPSLILGFFSGAFIDRLSRKAIIVTTDILRGIIIIGFAALFYLDAMNFYIVLALQVVLSINAAFFDPTIPSLIPMIVDDKKLGSANAKHQLVNGFSTIAGAFLGGIFISWIGYLKVFVLNGFSFLISAVFESFIHVPQKSGQKLNVSKPTGLLEDIKKGYGYIFSNQALVVLLFMVALIHFFVGSIEVIMPVVAVKISGNSPEILGFFHSALGLGVVLGAAVLSAIHIESKEKIILFFAVFCIGLLYAVSWFFSGGRTLQVALYLCMIFLFGICMISAGIGFKTLLQKNTDNRFAGRVFAAAGSIGNSCIPLAMILFGALLETFEHGKLLLISGLVLMILSIVSFLIYKEKEHDQK